MKKKAMDGFFLTIFHGERSELREKYGLARCAVCGPATAEFRFNLPTLDP